MVTKVNGRGGVVTKVNGREVWSQRSMKGSVVTKVNGRRCGHKGQW